MKRAIKYSNCILIAVCLLFVLGLSACSGGGSGGSGGSDTDDAGSPGPDSAGGSGDSADGGGGGSGGSDTDDSDTDDAGSPDPDSAGDSGNGGDGGNTGGGGSGASSNRVTLNFFQRSDGGLRAIDPLNPAAPPLLVDADASPPVVPIIANAIYVELADYNPATAMVTDGRLERAFYSRSNGTLWQVPVARAGSEDQADTPMPLQVSSENGAAEICSAEAVSGFGAIEQVNIVYQLPGPDRECSGLEIDNDNIWRLVRLGMNASEPPLDFPGRPETSLIDPTDGTHAGWLTQDVNSLLYVTPDLATTQLGIIDSFVTIFGEVRTGHVFLNLDGDLQLFDLTGSRTLVDTGFDFPVNPRSNDRLNLTGGTDDEQFFFVAATANSSAALHTADVEGNVNVLFEPTDAADSQLNAASITTAERVILGYETTSGATKFVSLTKSGADLQTLHISSSLATFAAFTPAHEDGYVFIREGVGIDQPPDFLIVRDDGSEPPIRIEDSVERDFSLSFPYPAFGIRRAAGSVFILEGVQSGGLALAGGSVLSVFNVSDPSNRLTLGQIPDEINDFFPAIELGRFHLGQATEIVTTLAPDPSVEPRSDIFFFDQQTPDSLLRITNTPDLSEFPLTLSEFPF